MAVNNVSGTYSESFGEAFQWHILAVASRLPAFCLKYRSALHHTYFGSDLQRVIAKALLEHVDKYQTLPTYPLLCQDVSEMTKEDVAAKAHAQIEKMFAADISDAQAVMDKAVEFGKLMAMCNAIIECGGLLDKGDRTQIMPKIQEAQRVGDDVTDIGIEYRIADRSKWYGEQYAEERIPTGFTHLDYAMGGGSARGGLYVLLAPPKKMKSTSLINIAFGALINPDGLNIVYATNEIIGKNVGKRLDDRLAGKFHALKKTDPTQYATIMQDRVAKYLYGRLFLKTWPTRTCTPSMLRSYLTMQAAYGFKVDRLIVDYADIMRAERRLGEMRFEQAGIYEDLRGIGGEFDCDVWTASQANKIALSKETLDMSDFAEAFEKAAVMDVGIAICQTEEEEIHGRCRYVIIGSREGGDGMVVEAKVDKPRCMIRSTALFDAALMQIHTGADDPDEVKTATISHGTGTGLTSHGNKPGAGKVTFKKGVFKKTIEPPVQPVKKVVVKK